MNAKIMQYCTENHLTIASAESITGGGIASRLTSISGSSAVFQAGVVCYSEHSKVHSAGVDIRLINEVGVYNEAVVAQMAERIAKRNIADIGISTSGQVENGEVFFGLYTKRTGETQTCMKNFQNETCTKSREEIQNKATDFALTLIYNSLL